MISDKSLDRLVHKQLTGKFASLYHSISPTYIAANTQHCIPTAMPDNRQQTETTDASKTPQRGVSKPKKPVLTHFLCLPLVTPTSRPLLERSLHRFKNELSSLRAAGGDESASSMIDDRAVRPVGTLHLTLGVMSLKEAGKLAEAVRLLQTIDVLKMLEQAAARSRSMTTEAGSRSSMVPLKVDLRGVASMHSPSKTSVLYTSPMDSTGRLLSLCEQLRDVFVEKGLLVKDDRPLKLHVTVVNTIYVKGRPPAQSNADRGAGGAQRQGDSGQPRRRNRRPGPVQFDARPAIEHLKDFAWAEDVLLDRIAICEMGAKKVVDEKTDKIVEEAYKEVAIRALPTG